MIGRGMRIARPRRLKFPIVVKPLKEEASLGIAQASFVQTDEQFKERVQFIHEKYDNDVIAEEYIEGRELYVSLLGNHRLQVFPIRELVFQEVPPDEPKLATYKAKWDEEYRKPVGAPEPVCRRLDPTVAAEIERTSRRIYRLLAIDGYARLDLRLTLNNEVYFIEANPNPILAEDEDFAQSALKAGLPTAVDRPDCAPRLKTVRDEGEGGPGGPGALRPGVRRFLSAGSLQRHERRDALEALEGGGVPAEMDISLTHLALLDSHSLDRNPLSPREFGRLETLPYSSPRTSLDRGSSDPVPLHTG